MRRDLVRAWLPVGAYMALIFLLSSMSLPGAPVSRIPFGDKGAHFLEYLVLGALCARACTMTWPKRPLSRTVLLGIFVASAWGFSDEIHQAFVPSRSADYRDWFADTFGALVGGALAYALLRFRRRDRHETNPESSPAPTRETGSEPTR